MIGRHVLAGVMALTLAGSTAFAAEEPPVSAPAPAATPLVPRKQPIALAPPPASTPVTYKVIAVLGVAAAAALYLRKRKQQQSEPASKRSVIDIVGRSSLGVRSELIVVDVEGTRLLVGMTPSSIQTLAVLEQPNAEPMKLVDAEPEPSARSARYERDDEDAGDRARRPVASSPGREMGKDAGERGRSLVASGRGREMQDSEELHDRVRSLLGRPAAASRPVPTSRETPSRAIPQRTRSPRVAGQAKGLMLALENGIDEEKVAR